MNIQTNAGSQCKVITICNNSAGSAFYFKVEINDRKVKIQPQVTSMLLHAFGCWVEMGSQDKGSN